MDNLPNDQPSPQPIVQVIKTTFFQTRKGKTVLATILGIVIFVMLIIILNFFDIISPAQFSFLPKRSQVNLTGTAVKITLIPENYGFRAGELTLSCPVDSAFCKSQKLAIVNKADAVTYKAASQSSVLNLTKPQTLENIAVLENKKDGKKYFYESVVSKNNDSCYTIAYTLPADATFGDFFRLPFIDKNATIATLGSKTFEIEGKEANVVIQVRNTPMDPGVPCSLIRKSPEFFKSF